MKKNMIFYITIFVVILLIIGYFSMNTNRWLSSLGPTYTEAIESNWDVRLPTPDSINYVLSNRGWQGDGEAIAELYYEQSVNIQEINELSEKWVSGEEFVNEQLPNWVESLVNSENIEIDAKYFYMKTNGNDYIVFKLNGHKLTVYETYQ